MSIASLLLWSALALGAAEGPITLGTQSSATKDGKHLVTVKVFQGKTVLSDENLPKSKGATDAACFALHKRDSNGNLIEEVQVDVKVATAQGIQLIPKKSLDFSKGTWSLFIHKNCLTPSHTISNRFEDAELPINPDAWKRDEEFLKNGLPESKVELKQGSKTGVVSFNASFKRYFDEGFSELGTAHDSAFDRQAQHEHLFALTDALIQGHLSVDASIEPSEKGQYLNNLEGEIGGYVSGVALSSLTEIGFSTKTQADQEFEKVDQTAGINLWMWVNQNWMDNIARALFLVGERPPYQDHLLVIAGDDYVGHIKNPSIGNRDYNGNNRLYVRLYWEIPVARGIDLHAFSPIDQQLDVNLVADAKATYDVENSSIAPEVKLSLDFQLSKLKVGTKQPSISFSYVDGRAAPKFEHFDALLAGMKIPF